VVRGELGCNGNTLDIAVQTFRIDDAVTRRWSWTCKFRFARNGRGQHTVVTFTLSYVRYLGTSMLPSAVPSK
jgi:hypothetical protein